MLVPGARTAAEQPGDHVLGVAAPCGIERREVVMSDPVEVSAAIEEVFGRAALSAMARTPEGIRDLARRRSCTAGEEILDLREEPERGGVPQGGAGAARHQPARRIPL